MLGFFQNFPPQLATLLIGAIPITELRAAIPVALEVYHLSVLSAVFWALVGNIGVAALVVWLIGPMSDFLRQHIKILDRFFVWLFARTRKKFKAQYIKYGEIGLVVFVAIPLPGTGAWTGAIAAWLFGIPPKKSFCLVSLGVLIAGFIVTLATLGVVGLAGII